MNLSAGDQGKPDPDPGETGDSGRLFRDEALRHRAGQPQEGDVLRLTPAWMRWTYWLLLGGVLAGLAFMTLGRVKQYASGPAVVRLEGRTDLTSPVSGIVAGIEVQRGQPVTAGAVLVRLHAAVETAELERARQAFEAQLAKQRRDPSDDAARRASMGLRADLDLAAARLEQRLIRAPREAVIRDIRAREGERIEPGQVVISLDPRDPRYSLLALLPGHARPMLHEGMLLHVEMSGYSRMQLRVPIGEIGDHVIGPAEVGRLLGPEVADTISPPGPVVLVRAELPGAEFDAAGERYGYYDGMPARAETAVRSESIVYTLFPGLKSLLGD